MRRSKSSKRHLLIGILISISFIYLACSQNVFGDSKITIAAEPNVIFGEGNKAYQNGNFQKAAETYQQLCDEGYLSGDLYYNLGNAYFKLGAKGLAVLNYERANRLIPGDADLKANQNYVLAGVQEGAIDWKYELLKFLTGMAPVSQLVIFSSICFYGLAIFIILGIIKPAPLRKLINGRYGKWWTGMIIGGALIFCICCSLAILTFWDQSREQAVAIKSGDVRFEPSKAATLYYKLTEGSRVLILEEKNEWFKVKRVDGKRGWVEKNCLEMI